MALILWLPLIEDVTNQGLYPFPNPSYKSMTIGNTGIIGKCHNGTGIIYHLSDQSIIKNQWTLAMWVKSSSWGANNDVLLCKNSAASDHCQIYFSVINHASLNIGVNGTYNNGTSYTYSFEANTWYHFATSYDGQTLKLYINGEMVKSIEKVTTLFTDCDNLCVGNRSTNAGGTAQTGGNANKYFNDVRIYDNALSDKEVEVLARGLVLHYPLDREGFGQDNLILNSKSLDVSHLTSGNEYIAINAGQSYMDISSGTTVTISFDLELNYATQATSFLVYNTNNKGPKQIDTKNVGNQVFDNETVGTVIKKRIYVVTVVRDRSSTSTVNNFIEFYTQYNTGNVFSISNLKMEIGDKATPWTPAPTDALYADMGLDTGIVYDASGYKRNGTASGVTYSGDTAKYLASTSFDGIDDGITLPEFGIGNIFNNSCTISFWVKPNGENGARSVYLGAYNKTSWNIEKTAANNFRAWWNGTPNDQSSEGYIVDGSWQHLVITKNGTNDIKFYYNGEFKQQFTGNHSTLTFGTPWRIGRDSRSNDGTQYKGLMSDFRIYATPLSDEAIAELYHTGASLADNGTLMTSQYVEV